MVEGPSAQGGTDEEVAETHPRGSLDGPGLGRGVGAGCLADRDADVDPDDSMDEMWVAVGAYPGFLCGALFSAVVGIADGRRRLDELSLSGVGAWGAACGLLVGLFPLILGTPSTQRPLWFWAAVIIGPITLLSAVSAIVSALLARMATNRELPGSAGAA